MEHALKVLAEEWEGLSVQAELVRQRKSEIRDLFEPWFNSKIPQLNQELQSGSGYASRYFFYPDVSVGYTPEGPLLLSLIPRPTEEWVEVDEHDGWVDMERADALEKLVNASHTIQEVRALFPHIEVDVEYNMISFDVAADLLDTTEEQLNEAFAGKS